MAATAMKMKIRDRVKKLIRIKPSLLVPAPLNYRKHPEKQKQAFRALANKLGIAGAVLVRELGDGRYMLIDGHLRSEEVTDMGDQPIPALVLDVTEEEGDMLLASYDWLGDLAESDGGVLNKLLRKINPGDEVLVGFFSDLAKERGAATADDLELDVGGEEADGEDAVPGDDTAAPEASHVRMVQLFLNTDTLPPFQEDIEFLGELYGTSNTTDTVLAAVKRQAKLERRKQKEE